METEPDRSRALWLAAALVTAGAAIRLWGIGAQSLWVDEAFSATLARLDLADLVRAVRTDTSFPLYYLLLKLAPWTDAGETGLRLPSALLSTATLPVVYALARRVAGARAGIFALLLVSVSPLQTYYAREARCYAALSFATALAVLGLVRTLGGAGRSGALTYAAAATAVLYLHASGIIVVLAAAAVGIGFAPTPAIRARILRVNLAVGAAFLPWIPSFLVQLRNAGIDWHEPFWRLYPPALVLLRTLEAYSFTPATPAFVGLEHWPALAAIGGIAWVALAAIGLAAPGPPRRNLSVVLAVVATTVLAHWGASFVRPTYLVGRTDVHLFPLLAVGVAAGLARLASVSRGLVTGVLAVLVALALSTIGGAIYVPAEPAEREAAAWLAARLAPGDLVILCGRNTLPVAYHLRRGPPSERRLTTPFWDDAARAPELEPPLLENPREVVQVARAAAARGGRVWAVLPEGGESTPILDLLVSGAWEEPAEPSAYTYAMRRLYLPYRIVSIRPFDRE